MRNSLSSALSAHDRDLRFRSTPKASASHSIAARLARSSTRVRELAGAVAVVSSTSFLFCAARGLHALEQQIGTVPATGHQKPYARPPGAGS
jgi:hypothetical protein